MAKQLKAFELTKADLTEVRKFTELNQDEQYEKYGCQHTTWQIDWKQCLADSLAALPLDFFISSTDSEEQKETAHSLHVHSRWRQQLVQMILSHNYRGKSQNRPIQDPNNHLEIQRAWQEWIEVFEKETLNFKNMETKDNVSALKIYGRSEINKLAQALPNQAPVTDDNIEQKKLKRKLDNSLLPKKNKHHAQ